LLRYRKNVAVVDDGRIEEIGREMVEAPDWVRRAKAANGLAALFCSGALNAAEQLLAEEYFRLTRFDPEVLVRRVLAESLKRSTIVSRDTVWLFATDRAEVAIPLIECSPALADADLLQILREESECHRLAVARRYRVPAPVVKPILAGGDEPLIAALLRNPGAVVADDALYRLIRSRALRPPILDALARRWPLLLQRLAAIHVANWPALS
jgi:uncharacterized protein (DUF2336 family)